MVGLSDRYKNNPSNQEERKKKERATSRGTKEPGYVRKNLVVSRTTGITTEKSKTTQKTRFVTLQATSKIEDYKSYKTQ